MPSPRLYDRSRIEAFAAVYNDARAYPTLNTVADRLGLSRKTVQNIAGHVRAAIRLGHDYPALLSRIDLKPETTERSPEDHAETRARALESEMHRLFIDTDLPVTNPGCIVTKPSVVSRYDRVLGKAVKIEGAPRVWLTDTLRVAPVHDPRGRRFLFTGAQNDAPVHAGFWINLQAYAADIGAQIVIGPWTYETNWWDETSTASRVYDPAIRRHLCFGQLAIGNSFVFCGEMNTLPTATRPISDLALYAAGRWAVFPHAKVELISVPAANPKEQAAQVMTTGAVTMPMVIPRKAGIKAIGQHTIGATLVEFDADGDLFCRQILADEDGSFQDLDALVRDGQVQRKVPVVAVTFADIHAAKLSTPNARASLGIDPVTGARVPGSMLEALAPDMIVFHDLHDHESRNHHHRDDVSHNFEMAISGRASVVGELHRAVRLLQGLVPLAPRVLIVESNHDLALERYVKEGRYRGDGENFLFGLEMDLALHRYVEARAGGSKDSFSLLEWALRKLATDPLDNVFWAYDGHGFTLDGVQIGMHGFRGTNGSKGSVAGFARLGHKITIGDKHSPQIMDGVYVAGVMQLDHGYNKGPSGWAVSHVVQYRNGNRALVTMQKGKWRA